MKSAFLIAFSDNLFEDVGAFLHAEGAFYDPGRVAQFRDQNHRFFTVFPWVGPESEVRIGPFVSADGSPIPDMSSISACIIECRWEDLFVTYVARIARALGQRAWILDSECVIWPAEAVDPERVRL
jgi:hypothetical protein